MPDLCVVVDGREAVEAGLVRVEVSEEDGVEVPSLLQDAVLPTAQSLLAVEPTNVWKQSRLQL